MPSPAPSPSSGEDDGNVERHAGNLGTLAQDAFVAEHHKARGQPDLIHVKQLRCKFRADPGRIAHRKGYGGQSKLRHEELLALQTKQVCLVWPTDAGCDSVV